MCSYTTRKWNVCLGCMKLYSATCRRGHPAPPHAARRWFSAPCTGPGRACHGPARTHERFTNLRGVAWGVWLRVRASGSRPSRRSSAAHGSQQTVCHGSPAPARRSGPSTYGSALSPTPQATTWKSHWGARSGPRHARPGGPAHGAPSSSSFACGGAG